MPGQTQTAVLRAAVDAPSRAIVLLPSRIARALDRFFLVHEREIGWLDGLRVVAVGLVFLFHFSTGPYRDLTVAAGVERNNYVVLLAEFGWSGVPLFFVISGFLVGGGVVIGLLEGRFDPLRFFLRRIVRTVPPALALMVLFLALYSPSVTINAQLFQNLFFVSNYTSNGFLGHWWSLCVEEHFYLGLCLIASLAGHKLRGADPFRVRSVLILGAIAVALLKLAAAQGVTAYVYTHWQLDFFMVGMALRLSYENKKEDRHGRPRLLSLAALFGSAFLYIIAAAICAHSLSPNEVFILGHMPADFMPAASVLALIMAVTFVWSFGFDGSWLSRLCSLRPLRWIAGISYSMYLVHLFVLNYPIFSNTDPRVLISWISPHDRFYLVRAIPIEITATIAVSIIYFVVCERPMLRLRRHLSR